MFIDAQLMEIAKKANLKNNLSINEAKMKMYALCIVKITDEMPNGNPPKDIIIPILKRVNNYWGLVCSNLHKEGIKNFNYWEFKDLISKYSPTLRPYVKFL